MTYIGSVYQPLEQISTTVGNIHEELVQFNSSLNLLDTDPEVQEKSNAIELGRAEGHIAIEGLGFSYRGRNNTLEDIELDALPGERIAMSVILVPARPR